MEKKPQENNLKTGADIKQILLFLHCDTQRGAAAQDPLMYSGVLL